MNNSHFSPPRYITPATILHRTKRRCRLHKQYPEIKNYSIMHNNTSKHSICGNYQIALSSPKWPTMQQHFVTTLISYHVSSRLSIYFWKFWLWHGAPMREYRCGLFRGSLRQWNCLNWICHLTFVRRYDIIIEQIEQKYESSTVHFGRRHRPTVSAYAGQGRCGRLEGSVFPEFFRIGGISRENQSCCVPCECHRNPCAGLVPHCLRRNERGRGNRFCRPSGSAQYSDRNEFGDRGPRAFDQ